MDLFLTLSIGAAILATSAIIAYKLFRRRHPATISCWFCGEKCEIPYHQVNSWDCPYCEQYNGFTEDGDYNKSIPAQFCEELNVSSISRSSSPSSLHSFSNGREAANVLCGSCSQNQLMKIKQLANFMPSTEENFDLEAEAYHHHLEQVYRLCRVCELNVNHELARQNAALRAKMKEDEIGQTPQRHQAARDNFQGSWHGGAAKSRSAKVAGILQLVSITCALAILIASCDVAFTRFLHLNLRSVVPLFFESCLEMLADRVVLLLITGAFARILAVFISGLNRLQIVDALSCFNWLVLLLLFFILEDSHIYSRSLLILRVSLSSVNLILSVLSALRCSRSILQVEQISLRVEQEDSNLSQFSDVEQESASPEMPSASDSRDAVADVPYGQMRMLRLGTPRPKEVRKDFSFELFGNTNGGNTTSTPSLELRPGVGVGQRYPLLSPARFCPSPASVPQRRSYPNGVQQGITKTSDFSMTGSNGRIAKERVNGLTRRKASQKTKPNGEEAPLNVETPKRLSLFGNCLRVVLGVSLAINLIVILCVFLKFQSVLPIEVHNIHHFVKKFFKNALFS